MRITSAALRQSRCRSTNGPVDAAYPYEGSSMGGTPTQGSGDRCVLAARDCHQGPASRKVPREASPRWVPANWPPGRLRGTWLAQCAPREEHPVQGAQDVSKHARTIACYVCFVHYAEASLKPFRRDKTTRRKARYLHIRGPLLGAVPWPACPRLLRWPSTGIVCVYLCLLESIFARLPGTAVWKLHPLYPAKR